MSWELTTGDPASSLSGSAYVPIYQDGGPKRATAAQFAALVGGSVTLTGDVSATGTGSLTVTIGAHKVTFSKLVAASQKSLIGATGAGDFQEITLGAGLAMSVGGVLSASTGVGIADGTYADITVSGSGAALTINSHAVTFPKIQSAPSAGIIGATTAGNYGHLTLGSGLTLVGSALTASATFDPEQTRDTIAAALVAGTGISITPNDALDTITIACTVPTMDAEAVRDTIGATLVGGTGITVSVNDVADTITIAATGGAGTPLTAEDVRDTIGATLVAGSGVGITVNDALDTITITASGGSSLSAADRTALAAVTGMVNNDVRYLAEDGREGWFKFSSANLSASVTLDPDQGLFVAPASTTGSSGAWRRVMPLPGTAGFNDIRLTWFGITSSTVDAAAAINRAIVLAPVGARVLGLGRGVALNVKSAVIVLKPYLTLEEIYISHDASISVFDVLAVNASGFKLRNSRVHGKPSHAFANNPANVIIGYVRDDSTQLSDIEVSGCLLTGGSEGVIVSATNTDTVISRTQNVRIFNNVIMTDTQGVSLAGVDGAAISNNVFKMTASTPNNASCLVRCWGSKNVVISGNVGNSTGEMGFWLTALVRSVGGGNPDIRLQNEDIAILNNGPITGCSVGGLDAGECLGTLTISGNVFRDSATATTANFAFRFQTSATSVSPQPRFGRVIVQNNVVEGFSNFMYRDGTTMTRLTVKGNTWSSNARAASYPGPLVYSSEGGGCPLIEFYGNSFLAYPSNSMLTANFRVRNTNAGDVFRAFNNTLPEPDTTGPPSNPLVIFHQSGSGIVQFARGGETDTLRGANTAYPAGAYASFTSAI